MLDKVLYNNTIEDWGISILIITVALLINKLLDIFCRMVVKKIIAKSKSHLGDIFITALEKPIFLGILLFAIWIAASRLQLAEDVKNIISSSYDILITLNITWFFARFATALIEEMALGSNGKKQRERMKIDTRLLPVARRSALIIVWIIGIVTALNNAGIQAATLLGTLGIGGIAFALAAQDTIKNIFGGFTIFTDKTFRIGDVIKFDSVEGTVVDIGLRSTRIRNYDKRLLTIPNYKLTDAIITNISSESARRIVQELGLTYHTSPKKMQEAMRLLSDMPNRIPEIQHNDIVTSFTQFEDSALVITFIYFIQKSANIFETRSKVNMEILRAFNEAGLAFAFPSRTLYMEK